MRIDASSLITVKPELMEMLKNLEAGDTLKGKVLEALGNSIAIRAAGGQIFTAVLMEGSKIPKGAAVELIVSNIADGKVYAQLKPESKAADVEVKVSELLRQLGLPVDEKNMEAARLLIKYSLPLNKEVVTNITGLQKSIDNLNQSTEGRIGLMLSGMDIKNTTVDVLNKIVIRWPTDLVNMKPEQTVSPRPEKTQAGVLNGSITGNEKSQGSEQTAVKAEKKNAVNEGNIRETTGSMKEAIGVIEKAAVNETVSMFEKGSTEPQKELVKEVNITMLSKSSEVQPEAFKGMELLKMLDKLGIEAGSEIKKFAGQIADVQTSIKDVDMEALTYVISKDMEATPKNLGMLMKNIENTDGISQFLDKLQQKIEVSDNPGLKEIKDSIRKVFLEPHQLEDSKEAPEQLKNIAKLGEKLENYLNSSGNKDPEIGDALSNLRDNIDFIRSINEHNNYMQLPLLINGETSTAKLYVFKEGKRSKAINPENATVLVALDLKNLGHLESLIGVKGKLVNVTFRVENKGIGSLIERQSILLKNLLLEKGYSMSKVKVMNLEQPFNLLSLETVISEGGSGKIHFDMRI
jgi:hypothetical protein